MLRKILLALVTAATPAGATTIFVAPVPGEDASAPLTRAIETAILKKVVDAEVVTPRALDTKLELDLRSCDDAACAVDFAQALGAEFVMRPSLSRVGGTDVLTLSLFSGRRSALLGQGQRKGNAAALVDAIPDLVSEVARAGDLTVVVEHVRSPPYIAYGEVGGGVAVLVASVATHAFAFAVAEPGYERAEFDRGGNTAWELGRPFAYAGPVLGYIVGGGLLGLGLYTLAREAP